MSNITITQQHYDELMAKACKYNALMQLSVWSWVNYDEAMRFYYDNNPVESK